METAGWRMASRSLFAAWIGCACLDMADIHAGLLTSYGADLTVPAWLYITTRSLDDPMRRSAVHRVLGRAPELTLGVLLGASAFTEVSQLLWPRGLLPGTFDPLDILAYAIGLSVCYAFDKRSRRQAAFLEAPDGRPPA